MKLDVRIISREDVKPSSPTPPHLRTYTISLLDQLIPSAYAPIILFYPNTTSPHNLPDVSERLEVLKKSLSDTLTRFYPLAGKIRDDLSINCNDEGVNFVGTQLSYDLNEFLIRPDLLVLNQLLPCEFFPKDSLVGTYVSNIQANVFECGGIGIGVCISHRILDGAALAAFLKSWSATARGISKETEVLYPSFVGGSLFPTNDLWLRDSSLAMFGSLFKVGKCVTKRFVFDNFAIDRLKDKAASSCPTRVETVSAFLWKCSMDSKRPSLLTHLVNLRKRLTPPLPDCAIGNLMWMAAAKYSDKSKPELGDLVEKVKEAISRIDDNFVRKLMGEKGRSLMSETIKEIGGGGVDYIGFSSWCNLGFYEADFGWGKPVWVCSIGMAGPMVLNLVILVDTPTRFGDGIEAWVTFDEQDMALFENNPELCKFATLDPSPLLSN